MVSLYHEIRTGGNPHLKRSTTQRWVFLHGLMGFGRNWLAVVNQLSTQDEVLLPDLRGHGKSPKPPLGSYGPDNYVDDLKNLVDQLNWDHFILVGHSMGGRIALHWACREPDRIQGLVLEDIGPEEKPNATEFFEKLYQAIPTPFVNQQEAKKFFLEDFANRPEYQAAGGRSLALFLLTNLEPTPQGWTWRFQPEAMLETLEKGRKPSVWHQWQGLSCPALVIRGQNSNVLSSAVFHQMLQVQPRAEGIEIPGVGHWVHSSDSSGFVKALNSWYEKTVLRF